MQTSIVTFTYNVLQICCKRIFMSIQKYCITDNVGEVSISVCVTLCRFSNKLLKQFSQHLLFLLQTTSISSQPLTFDPHGWDGQLRCNTQESRDDTTASGVMAPQRPQDAPGQPGNREESDFMRLADPPTSDMWWTGYPPLSDISQKIGVLFPEYELITICTFTRVSYQDSRFIYLWHVITCTTPSEMQTC